MVEKLGVTLGLCSSRWKEIDSARYNLERIKFAALGLKGEITIVNFHKTLTVCQAVF